MVQEAYLIQAYVTATDFCYTVYAILVSLRPKRFETVKTEHFKHVETVPLTCMDIFR
jgi:hypothetical protein